MSFKEQMSADKYLRVFLRQMEAIVFIIRQTFFATHAVLKIGEYYRIFSSFGWGIFGYVMRLGQSRVSKKIWWIIISLYTGQISQLWLVRCFSKACCISGMGSLHKTVVIMVLFSMEKFVPPCCFMQRHSPTTVKCLLHVPLLIQISFWHYIFL